MGSARALATSEFIAARSDRQVDGLSRPHDGKASSGHESTLLPVHKGSQRTHHGRDGMVNEDEILLVSGGFSMDASQNSLAEQVAHMVDASDHTQQDYTGLDHCVDTVVRSQNALDAPVICGGKASLEPAVPGESKHLDHRHPSSEKSNDTEPGRGNSFSLNQSYVPGLATSSLQAHAQAFIPAPYTPDTYSHHSGTNSQHSLQPGVGGESSAARLGSSQGSHMADTLGGAVQAPMRASSMQPSGERSGDLSNAGSTAAAAAVAAAAAAAAAAGAANTVPPAQAPFGTIDENEPTSAADLAADAAGEGTVSFGGGMGSRGPSFVALGGAAHSRSYGNMPSDGHNQPERDYSTELLLRDAMYPATQNAMFPSLKLPELSMDGGNISYGPAQTASDLQWQNGGMQHQGVPAHMAGQIPAQMGGQMAGLGAGGHAAAAQFGAAAGAVDAGVMERGIDYSGSNAESSAAGGSSSFFERMYGHGDMRDAALRGWHPGSTPTMAGVGIEGSTAAHVGASLSPRHLQTGPAWDQMPGIWRGVMEGQGMGYEGHGGQAGLIPGQGAAGYAGSMASAGGMPEGADPHGAFLRDGAGTVGMGGGAGNIWLRGGSHPQLASLGRGSTAGYNTSVAMGSMPKGGGGSFGGDLWKHRNPSSVSLNQLQRASVAGNPSASYAAAGSGSGSSGSRAPSEHPLGEYPSRTLFVRNINIHTTDEELLTIFSQCGEVRSMYTSCKHRGFVMISYYDIRASTRAKQVLQGFMLRQRAVDIHYSVPKENAAEPDLNQGTLVVFNMDSSIPRGQILDLFSQFGEVKEIRATPKKEGHKFVEFYDSRHAHAALQGLNRVIVAGRQLKIELSRPGGVRRARNSQQNLTALYSENSSSHNDLLAASSMGSGAAAEVPLTAHSLPTSSVQGGLMPGGGSGSGGLGASNSGGLGAQGRSGSASLQGSTELQAMFQNLMLQAAQPAGQSGSQSGAGGGGQHGGGMGAGSMQGGLGGLSGPSDSFQTPPDTPAAEGSLQDPSGFGQPAGSGAMSVGVTGVAGMPGPQSTRGGGANSGTGGDSGVLPTSHSAAHSAAASVAHSPATGEDGFAAHRAWAANSAAAASGAAATNVHSFAPSSLGALNGMSGASSSEHGGPHMHAQTTMAAASNPSSVQQQSFMPAGMQHHSPQGIPQSDSGNSLHSFYNALLRQFASNPSAVNTSPESMEGSYQSMLSELLQGSAAAGAPGQHPGGPLMGGPAQGISAPNAAARMFGQPPRPAFHSGPGGQVPNAQLTDTGMGANAGQMQGGMAGGGGGNSTGGALTATLAAAAASAAAALARDPNIPPEEHEARLQQHLMEQLSNMQRHALGQNLMDQYKSHTPPPPSPGHAAPPHHSPRGPGGVSPGRSPSHPPSIGSPHRSPHSSLPHSPRGLPPGPRGPHPLSSLSHFTPSPPPAPPSIDSDLNSPGRGGSCSSPAMRAMSPAGHRFGGSSTPRPISARHSRSPLAGGHSNASSLPASVAGSYNSVGEFLDPGGGGSRRASHSGEHFILSPEAVGTGPGQDSRTTLMIRNIPNKYTQKVLMQTIDNAGFYGKYDFFYLPIDFKNRCNVGYAFINMASTEGVSSFYEEFNNKGWERFNSEKRCCVAYARIQTRRALIAHFQNSSLMHEDKRCRPVLLNLSGPTPEVEEFPPPRRASHSSHSRRGGYRSGGSVGGRRESLDSGGAASHRGSGDGPVGGGSAGPGSVGGNNTPRLSQEFPFSGAPHTK